MGLFDDRRPRRVRTNVLLDAEQVAAVRQMAQRAGHGVTLSAVLRAAVREGLKVLNRKMQEAAKQ